MEIVCGTSAKNALPSTAYTASWEIGAVFLGDWIHIGWSCFTSSNCRNAGASSSSCVICIGAGTEPFGSGA